MLGHHYCCGCEMAKKLTLTRMEFHYKPFCIGIDYFYSCYQKLNPSVFSFGAIFNQKVLQRKKKNTKNATTDLYVADLVKSVFVPFCTISCTLRVFKMLQAWPVLVPRLKTDVPGCNQP